MEGFSLVAPGKSRNHRLLLVYDLPVPSAGRLFEELNSSVTLRSRGSEIWIWAHCGQDHAGGLTLAGWLRVTMASCCYLVRVTTPRLPHDAEAVAFIVAVNF
jgi:hypothetical protein